MIVTYIQRAIMEKIKRLKIRDYVKKTLLP